MKILFPTKNILYKNMSSGFLGCVRKNDSVDSFTCATVGGTPYLNENFLDMCLRGQKGVPSTVEHVDESTN